MTYADFLATKRRLAPSVGIAGVDPGDLDPRLFGFQAHVTAWALRKGRAAAWLDTGLGKTAVQVEWARQIMRRTGVQPLILAPLAVAEQTVRLAGEILDAEVTYVADAAEARAADGIVISNYDRLHLLDPKAHGAVVLDESSVIKDVTTKTRDALIAAFADTPYRLACSATPAPNDVAELANHAQFLGAARREHMLSTYFIHDQNGWRLKGHAEDAMYRWMATWAVAVRTPSDLGYSDEGYDLPPLSIVSEIVAAEVMPVEGELFSGGLGGVAGRARARRETLPARVDRAVDLVRAEPDEPWLLWCGLNEEADRLAAAIPGAVNVHGGMPREAKAAAMLDFAAGKVRTLVTKPSIARFGMNWQHCARMAFVGLSDSYEDYYQCIRRSYRFGQARPVQAHIVLSEVEAPIAANVAAKEREAQRSNDSLVRHMRTEHALEATA
jgi:Helicase conserved C-terminal domain